MKKFFQEIKADLKFKTAGPGQKLSESPREKSTKEKPKPDAAKCRQGPTNEAQMAAAAALARLEQKPKPRPPSSQDAIRNQVKKELMAEAAASDKGLPVDQKHAARDPVAASVMQIHTFNRDREKVKLGVETIAKYLDNIHLHPEEEKYRKIKVQNKVFQERIHCLEGTDQFFQAVGFEKVALDVAGQGKPSYGLAFPNANKATWTFYAREPVSALFHFVRETLQNDWLPFELLAPGGHRLTDENLALNESGLVPSALLTFVWDAEVMEDIKASRGEHMGSVLKPDLLLTVQMLS
ncbi:UBX domain-containing protein 6 [Ophiophagus hannah]|uniref:UBX domain-containing protein 6 n=1 Tax=Ophiophagus hannah TaxID=8665 RepID=V8NHN3_OPHHA|nr:UBX domain-containing protein 6 [Ophiophagus hannah]